MEFASKKVFVGRAEEDVDEEELQGVRQQVEVSNRASTPAGARPPPQQRKKQVVYNATNVMALDLPSLVSAAAIATGDILRCACGAVFSGISKVEGENTNNRVWNCEFCRALNPFTLADEERPVGDTVDYLLSGPKHENASADEFSVLFVVDTSGSMCVSQPVEANKIKLKGAAAPDAEILAFQEQGAMQALPNERQGVQYVSRLQCVQAAVESQILALKKSYPKCRVGVVSFSSEVVMLGDGTSAPFTVAGDRLNNVENLITVGSEAAALQPVAETAERLVQALYKLSERGTTALGPGLCVALGMTTGAAPGSKIIICTDGLANMGVGNIEDAQDIEAVWSFYRDVASRAKQRGVPISVISIAGTQCKMEVLGSIAEISGGDVDIIKADEVLTKFANLADEKVIATNVQLTLMLDRRMTIVDPLKPGFIASSSTKDVGTVTATSLASFEFKVRDGAVAAGIQVQIRYSRLDGSELVRVQTLQQSVTQDKKQAEEEINIKVVAQNAVQSAAEYAASGDYGRARERMVLQQRLMQRASPSPAPPMVNNNNNQNPMYAQQQQQQQQVYNGYLQQATELDDLLQQQERAEAPGMSEEAARSSRINSRGDTLSKAIYKAKSNRK